MHKTDISIAKGIAIFLMVMVHSGIYCVKPFVYLFLFFALFSIAVLDLGASYWATDILNFNTINVVPYLVTTVLGTLMVWECAKMIESCGLLGRFLILRENTR